MTEAIWEELSHYLRQYGLKEQDGCVHELVRSIKEEERQRTEEVVSVVKGMQR